MYLLCVHLALGLAYLLTCSLITEFNIIIYIYIYMYIALVSYALGDFNTIPQGDIAAL